MAKTLTGADVERMRVELGDVAVESMIRGEIPGAVASLKAELAQVRAEAKRIRASIEGRDAS
jgi:hypothetical protein